ncbi:MAG: ARMT1-like domain-containing protein [Deltaproteobacteria bacterium]
MTSDTLVADAKACAWINSAESSTTVPAAWVPRLPPTCSPEFQWEFDEANLIISKGQGNFETLSEIEDPIFFLLLVKCRVVASHAAAITGL